MKKRIVRNLRLYFIGAWYSYRALFAWFTLEGYIASKIAYPFFMLTFFILMGRFAGLDNQLYIVTGNVLLLTSLNGVLGVTQTVGNERNFRTLPYLLGSPAPRGPLFLGRAFFNVVDGVFTVVVAMVVAILFFGLDLSQANIFLVAACILLISLSSSGIGLILGNIALVTREGWTIASTVYYALFLLCGVNFPVTVLPLPLQTVAYALPLTRGIEAARQAIAGADWATVAPALGSEAVIGLIYALIGYTFFRSFERRAMVTGQLDTV